MSDDIKHECGVAMIRLLKPLSFYKKKYNTARYALNKMYLLMQKQVNRGQDGAGLANIKLNVPPGKRYISRYRTNLQNPVREVFKYIDDKFDNVSKTHPTKINDVKWLKDNMPFSGEIFLGHLRYGTYGGNSIENCHPFLRQNNWKSRNLVLAGNFNMTNVDELFNQLIDLGQHPKDKSDTVTILEKIGHFLDEENSKIFNNLKSKFQDRQELAIEIAKKINVKDVLVNSAKKWDGGYLICGLFGHGDCFALRDPSGIRPGYFYKDDEIVIVASERAVIQTAMNVNQNKIHEISPGTAIIVKKNGTVYNEVIVNPQKKLSCSFERIYFSRGNDAEIYSERKKLGNFLADKILHTIKNDLKNTVFSFIPNTSETAFYGMIDRIDKLNKKSQLEKILKLKNKNLSNLEEIVFSGPRIEKIAIKDAKLRTFIADDSNRDTLVTHVYDITYGQIKKSDNLVIIDDSIVRGTTLKKSILNILSRLNPKKIVVVSSAPQIRYPDCYGIDMSKLDNLVAFKAAIQLLKERKMDKLIDEVYTKCKMSLNDSSGDNINFVKKIYEQFEYSEISNMITKFITPDNISCKVEIIFQDLIKLHEACPNHIGDWYFSGDYPTKGGNRFVNKAFTYYIEGIKKRAY